MQIPLFKVYMSEDAFDNVKKVLESGYIGEGPISKKFEQELRSYFKPIVGDITLLNSATSAEHLLYHYLKSNRVFVEDFGVGRASHTWKGMNKKSEVISTPLTCTATNWPILLNGLKIVWADVDPNSMNIDLNSIPSRITPNTRIVQVVHWGGNPVDVIKLREILIPYELKYGHSILIVEDCAHAFGSTVDGEYVGFSGNFSTFSLQAIKHITSVDGGFVYCPYNSVARDFKILRWYGIDRNQPRADFRCEADIPEIGFKFHMNDVSAAVGLANLKHAAQILYQNISNGMFYDEAFKNVDGIRTMSKIKGATSTNWLYTINVERRDDFMKYMNEHGVQTSRVHERNDKHSAVSEFRTQLPGVDSAVRTMACIPVGFWVQSEQREYILDLIKKGW